LPEYTKTAGEQEAKLTAAANELVPVERGGYEIAGALGRFLQANHFSDAPQVHVDAGSAAIVTTYSIAPPICTSASDVNKTPLELMFRVSAAWETCPRWSALREPAGAISKR